MNENEKQNLKDAISLSVQYRYTWIFSHLARAQFFQQLENNAINVEKYLFSLEDMNLEKNEVFVKPFIDLLKLKEPISWSDDEVTAYDSEYLREITRTAIRSGIIINIQSYFERHKVLDIVRKYKSDSENIFLFLLNARNIILHSPDGRMRSRSIKACEWNGIKIESNNNTFKISDRLIWKLIEEAIIALFEICRSHNIDNIDYVTLNLSGDIKEVRDYIKEYNK